MKKPEDVIFDEWLSLMEDAFSILTLEQFSILEDKIIKEIQRRRTNERNSRRG